MKTKLTLWVLLFAAAFSACKKDKKQADNTGGTTTTPSLLSNAQVGSPLSSGTINKFTFAHSGNEVILLVANNQQGKVFAIKLDDNNPDDASKNELTQSINGFGQNLAAAMGLQVNQLRISDMRINPVSRSIYILAGSSTSNERNLIKVTNNGAQIEALSLDNVTYSEISYNTAGAAVQDLTWGNNTLFASFRRTSTLNGELSTLKAPFSNGTTFTSRATTVYKTNWGGGYHTDAPLEKMTYLNVKGVDRLAGVTVCAPGFSFPTSEINSGTGLLEVKEYFNLNTRFPIKVFSASNNGKTYLMEFHDNGRFTRVGEHYIDGSPSKVNGDADYLLTSGGTVRSPGFTDEDVSILVNPGVAIMVAKKSETSALLITNNGALDYNFPLF